MPISYVSDISGNAIAVQIPIEEWNMLKGKYPNDDVLREDLPDHEKIFIEERLDAIKNNPARLRPIQELYKELDKND